MASTYSTWEYYHAEYHGTMGEGVYTKQAIKAAGEINRRTYGRAKTAPADMADALRDCECELVDALASFDASFALLPKGISSINNDGLSVATSYGSSKTDSREAAQGAEVRAICQKYLLEPVNLMYSGVGRC